MASPSPPDFNPMARAYLWVGRIFTICGEMIMPGILGYWLDQSMGWKLSIFAVIGFLVGLVFGMTHLVLMANSPENGGRVEKSKANPDQDDHAETIRKPQRPA